MMLKKMPPKTGTKHGYYLNMLYDGQEKMGTPESLVKAKIKAYLHLIGAYVFMPVQTGYGAASIDMLVCYDGRFYGLEVKREDGGEVTPRLEYVIAEIKRAGGRAGVVRSIADVQQLLSEDAV